MSDTPNYTSEQDTALDRAILCTLTRSVSTWRTRMNINEVLSDYGSARLLDRLGELEREGRVEGRTNADGVTCWRLVKVVAHGIG